MKTAKRPFSLEFNALELKLAEDSVNPHTIYFKEHSVREQNDDKPSGRTLFILNIPPYADEQGIKNAFSKAGIVNTVMFAEKPGPAETNQSKYFIPPISKPCFRVAYVVFDKVSHLDKALKLTKLSPMCNKNYQVKVGVEKWIEEYNKAILHPKALKESIETFMATFDEEVKLNDEKQKELEKEDDEGWVTVTKKGKVKHFSRSENVENKIMAKEEIKKKRKELKNFYTFQIRESKMKNIVALRQKFEEDKQKIQQIKQTRRFKPF